MKKINFPLINPWKSFSNAKNLRSVNFILQVTFYTKKNLVAILRIVFYRLPERVLHGLPLKSYINLPENCHNRWKILTTREKILTTRVTFSRQKKKKKNCHNKRKILTAGEKISQWGEGFLPGEKFWQWGKESSGQDRTSYNRRNTLTTREK